MKILIISILALVGVEICSAFSRHSCCETDLANFNANTLAFLTDFKTLHDNTHDIVVGVADTCAGLFKREFGFLAGDYSTNSAEARAALLAFIDETSAISTQFLIDFANINSACDKLLQQAGAYMKSNVLTCGFKFGKGCEAELNARRCEISAFLKYVKVKRDSAVSFVNQTVAILKDMGKLVNDFVATNVLTAPGCNDISYCQLQTAINEFFVEFNRLHWLDHIKFVNLQYICDDVTRSVSTLFVKYRCS